MIKLNTTNQEIIAKPPYVFKVFNITDVEILSSGDINSTTIYYRFSQDYGRTTSEWTEFTKDNIKSERINPIRFFQIEYLITYLGGTDVTIYDINLIGDFQNVTLDGQKDNVYGIRENCNCLMMCIIGDEESYIASGGDTSMLMGIEDTETLNLPKLSEDDLKKLYDPYQQQQALDLFSKLSSDITNMFGHEVVYILTDPDQNGIDYTFHEYTIENYVCAEELKVLVDQNQFPENTGAINNFDLSLFDTFEINITKDDFKKVFGVQSRPGVNDVLWFCNLNRIFTVEHSQAIRNFNNYSIYYKIMLKKYNEKSNIIGATDEMQSVIDRFKKNAQIDQLFGLENEQDKKAVANTEQFRTAAHDILRTLITCNIEQESIENARVLVSKQHYELSTVTAGAEAVKYRNFKYFYRPSDNIGFTCWFKLNEVNMTDTYYFFNYYDDSDNGFKFYMIGNTIYADIMGTTHELQFSTAASNDLDSDIWYSLVINVNQRQSKLEAFIYKRNADYEEDAVMLASSKLKQLYKVSVTKAPEIIEVDELNATLLGSDMKMTNIRMFIDVIPEEEHNLILNQEVIGTEYKYIIFSDNANKEVTLPFYEDGRINYDKMRRGTSLDDY